MVILLKVHDLPQHLLIFQYCFSCPRHVALNEICDMIMNDEMEEMGDKVMVFFVRVLCVWRFDTLLATVHCIR